MARFTVAAPFAGATVTATVPGCGVPSTSSSLPNTSMVTGVSSSVVAASSAVAGASFIALMVTFTVPTEERPGSGAPSSKMRYWKVSVPL